MRVELVVPVWGRYVMPWRAFGLPSMRAEAAEIGAELIVYTDAAGRQALASEGLAFRELAAVGAGALDRADLAHADALNRAVDDGTAIAPLMADMIIGRGTLRRAVREIEAGWRAVMVHNALTPMPPFTAASTDVLSRWALGCAGFHAWGRPTGHPGHYAWACPGGMLVRPIYLPPALLRPTRRCTPTRAMDHFMAEEFLHTSGQMRYLRPQDGIIISPGMSPKPAGLTAEDGPAFTSAEGVADWMLRSNAKPWTLIHFRQKLWYGSPSPGDRQATEAVSDAVVERIIALVGSRLER